MKSIKQRLAIMLAVLFILPNPPILAAETESADIVEDIGSVESSEISEEELDDQEFLLEDDLTLASSSDAEKLPSEEEPSDMDGENTSDSNKNGSSGTEEVPDIEAISNPAEISNATKISNEAEEEVKFNTGSHVFTIVSKEDFFDRELGDGFFEDDGSYTIHIPESNPFFPYEVQFIYEGEITREWFLTPEDTVEIGGHIFRVSAYFDGTVVTQMSMRVGGDTVVVYPDKKKFTDDEEADVSALSLMPLEERRLNLDLSAYTPVELTKVSLDGIFMGENALESSDQVSWTVEEDDHYRVSAPGDIIDLSHYTYDRSSVVWKMIVGDDNPLAPDNIRYLVHVKVTKSDQWLIPVVYVEDGEGNRTRVDVQDYRYDDGDYRWRQRMLHISAPHDTVRPTLHGPNKTYIGLEVNPAVFPNPQYDYIEVLRSKFNSSSDYPYGIFDDDMSQPGSGYLWSGGAVNILMVTYGAGQEGLENPTGELELCIDLWEDDDRFFPSDLRTELNGDMVSVCEEVGNFFENGIYEIWFYLYNGYALDGQYSLKLEEIHDGEVVAAYAGQYASISEAVAADAEDIKADLFGKDGGGYWADYTNGVHFTVFVRQGTSDIIQTLSYCSYVEFGGTNSPLPEISPYISFIGLKDAQGNVIDTCLIDSTEDSYGTKNYLTFLVGDSVDLSSLAPVFELAEGAILYTSESSVPEVSGVSVHDFSRGAMQYTVSAKSGTSSQNYWIQVVKAGTGSGGLYINSLADKNANTRIENGVIYSTREMFFTESNDYEHDIVLMNLGVDPIPAISVELESDNIYLDDYWMLNGEYPLPGVGTLGNGSSFQDGALQNQVKIRLISIYYLDEVLSGTLTIKSGDKVLMVLTLTGTIGGPGITTLEIPQAVKYVPYGTMIQNNNKYSWNATSYHLVDGALPSGMELLPNGELYGVPLETGTFTFTVRMDNSHGPFASSERTYTMTVTENTDTNVEAATDIGYELTRRIQNMAWNGTYDQTVVSQGSYDEFVAVYLDGDKLTEGQDYTSEEGSTRITIRGETLRKSNKPGKHTLGIEFRTRDTHTLKRAAQNYEITESRPNQNTSGGGSGGSSGGGSSASTLIRDPKKGYMHMDLGIITGSGDGYSNWRQDENGWKLIYADGTVAAGYMAEQSDGTTVEQIIWEKVNGAWYAFGVNEYLKSGWVFDYQFGSWYWVSVDKGMQSGWYTDTQDGFTYYMDPATGKLAAGWKQIDEKWYYFNGISVSPTWVFDEKTGTWFYNVLSRRKPYGAMFKNEETPDGYFVNEDGAWDGKEK